MCLFISETDRWLSRNYTLSWGCYASPSNFSYWSLLLNMAFAGACPFCFVTFLWIFMYISSSIYCNFIVYLIYPNVVVKQFIHWLSVDASFVWFLLCVLSNTVVSTSIIITRESYVINHLILVLRDLFLILVINVACFSCFMQVENSQWRYHSPILVLCTYVSICTYCSQ